MNRLQFLKAALAGSASMAALIEPAAAKLFDIPGGDLSTALSAYMRQSDLEIIYGADVVRGHRSRGAKGDYSETAALTQILQGTGLTAQAMSSKAIEIVPQREPERVAQAARRAPTAPLAPAQAGVETVVVTAEKKSENIQSVPISVTALSQQQLTERQIAGGPDLLRDVPNMNFGKTNFTGYSIELRGIGTQAISVTTDPAVAVAFNGTPFIRNHFFEQEFFDLDNVEVLRGPQGTLYGRNATAGVVNLTSAKPTDEYSANLSADLGNYNNRRFEGMINIPIVGDKLDLRIAAEWTKRSGYTTNENTGSPVDGRDLWSGRVTLGWKPSTDFQVDLVWERFSEDDNRMRTAKQLCHTAPEQFGLSDSTYVLAANYFLTQGCDANTSLYAASAFEVPNSNALPYACALAAVGAPVNCGVDPYASVTQSRNLRVIETSFNPKYRAKNDVVELNADYTPTPTLTLTSQTGFNHDSLWSNEDYNRFNTNPGFFVPTGDGRVSAAGVFCDPQIGCSDRLVAEDLSDETAWQLSQEFRLASNFSGPLNFSFGGNYLHYETKEDYYVFLNSLTAAFAGEGTGFAPYVAGVSDNSQCLIGGFVYPTLSASHAAGACGYLDPNPITSINGNGHNYFRSFNPYVLNSYASFGEAYYHVTPDLKFTGGLRWTEDQKHFTDIPSELFVDNWGYPSSGIVNQQWDQFTGRAVLTWTPQLSFTDQTMVYDSFSHGYKAGGANPPGAILLTYNANQGQISEPIHPLTFKPERIDAFEIGTKNTVLNGTLTLNADAFYYNYYDYQISRIVDRTSINDNFDAHVMGGEFESTWEPLPGLRFNTAFGLEDAELANGSKSIDLIDRTAGNPNWVVVKPFPTQASNCILPAYVITYQLVYAPFSVGGDCGFAYQLETDPVTGQPYVPNPTGPNRHGDPIIPGTYPGFDPATAPNNGEGFDKNLSHKRLPNAPPFTLSFGSEYTIPVATDWAATLRGDFYWQADSWARVFNDNPYDHLRGYTNLNLALILTSADGWTVMGYVKNVFNVTAITGDFLNSDDSGLTTNVFLTDPRLYGVRVTKDFEAGPGNGGYGVPEFLQGLFADDDHGKPVLWIELGGGLDGIDAPQAHVAPSFAALLDRFGSAVAEQKAPRYGFESDAKATLELPDSDWDVSVAVRYGRTRETGRQIVEKTTPTVVGYLDLANYPQYNRTFHIQPFAQNNENAGSKYGESYAVVDFEAGKDVGLGRIGADETSRLDLGVRAVQFAKTSSAAISGVPDFLVSNQILHYGTVTVSRPKQYWHFFSAKPSARDNFKGLGPKVEYDASDPLAGDDQSGELSVDWGFNGALLFGKQKTRVQHATMERYHPKSVGYRTAVPVAYSNTALERRTRTTVVPNLGAFVGLSYKYSNAKVSFGYRADEFFGAMDGGIDTRRSENMGFFGPYAKISVGLGG